MPRHARGVSTRTLCGSLARHIGVAIRRDKDILHAPGGAPQIVLHREFNLYTGVQFGERHGRNGGRIVGRRDQGYACGRRDYKRGERGVCIFKYDPAVISCFLYLFDFAAKKVMEKCRAHTGVLNGYGQRESPFGCLRCGRCPRVVPVYIGKATSPNKKKCDQQKEYTDCYGSYARRIHIFDSTGKRVPVNMPKRCTDVQKKKNGNGPSFVCYGTCTSMPTTSPPCGASMLTLFWSRVMPVGLATE